MRKPLKSVADSLRRILMSTFGGSSRPGDSPGHRRQARTSQLRGMFELPSQPGLENRLLLAAEIPVEFAEVSTIHDSVEIAAFANRQDVVIPLSMAQVSREAVVYRIRSLDANYVRVTYGSFRQIQPGSDRFTTTVNDSLSVKYGSPLDSTFVGDAESVFTGSAGSVGMTESQPPRHQPPGSFDSPAFEPESQAGRTSVPLSSRPVPPGPDRASAAPLIQACLPPFLSASSPAGPDVGAPGGVSPTHASAGSTLADANASSGIPAGGFNVASTDRPLSDFDAAETFGARSPELQFVHASALDRDLDAPILDAAGERTIARWQEGQPATDLAASPEATENPASPGIWHRISDAFDLDDSDFDPIGGDPLVEPAEIDTDALSAAVDRIIAGFVNPVEDSLESVRFGPTIGLAAGAFIAFQVYSRRRRSQSEPVREDPSEEAEPVTHVIPELDPVDDRGR